MKKTTKVLLITALVLFVAGFFICRIAFSIGGATALLTNLRPSWINFFVSPYDVVEDITDTDNYSHLEDISDTISNVSFHDTSDVNVHMNFDDSFPVYSGNHTDNKAAAKGDIKDMELSLGAASFEISTSKDDYFHILVTADSDSKFQYYTNGDTFYISAFEISHWHASSNTHLELQIPEDMTFDEVSIAIGAGSIDISALTCNELELECGAGNAQMKDITTDKLKAEVGAGTVHVSDAYTHQATVNCGMGKFTYKGIISDDLVAECGMGNITFKLDDAYTDHNYSLSGSMGKISLDGKDYSGLSTEQNIDHNSSSDYEAECAMGSITFTFKK